MADEPLQQPVPDPAGPLGLLLKGLDSRQQGLTDLEAERRLLQFGPNRIERAAARSRGKALLKQLTHPLALLLWAAAWLAWLSGAVAIAVAIVVVIVLNAIFAFIQEEQAERAVEALAAFIPDRCLVRRNGVMTTLDSSKLVPGDVLRIVEGDRISADARLLAGSVEVDMAPLTGESLAVTRSAEGEPGDVLIEAQDVVFSGTACTEGEATAIVFATGMRTELGRIAALSEHVEREPSPLELEVRKVAWLIAAVAVLTGLAFMPLGMLGAGLSFGGAAVFAIGLLVGNVPEGLLPVITLALAASARELAGRGAVVKRLSAAETLGSTTVICTDKTGTLTEGRMTLEANWTANGSDAERLLAAACRCSTATVDSGDPTESALLKAATELGIGVDLRAREAARLGTFPFSAVLKRMTTVDRVDGNAIVSVKGAPEAVIPLCGATDAGVRMRAEAAVDEYAARGLRVLAVAEKVVAEPPSARDQADRDLHLLGLVALIDRPRAEAARAVAACRRAGIRVFMVTGDHGLTAAAVARQVGIARPGETPAVITGPEVERLADAELTQLVEDAETVIFARTSPQTKLRIADAFREGSEVVAMTGDGANDAPALRRADIGIAMGQSGTDVAREASEMVLTDDNFATIVSAVEGGRRAFDNVRKFIFYIFAHSTPEVVPFVLFGLSGGAIPLPITIPLILALDVGTETLPALALGRERAEAGIMDRPPRAAGEGVIRGGMLLRAWLFLGAISAALATGIYLAFLTSRGWHYGADTGSGTTLRQSVVEGQTLTFCAMVMCQVGTAFAARTERVSLRSIGPLSNRLLLWGIAFELALTAAIVYLPPLQDLLGTAPPPAHWLAMLLPFPLIVWGLDEARRWALRSARARPRH